MSFHRRSSLEILLHEIGGEKEKIVEDSNKCPQNIETSPSSTGIEFRIKSEQVIEWEIEVGPPLYGEMGFFLERS